MSETSSPRTTFTLASRKSKLAVVQMDMVQAQLAAANPHLTFAKDTFSVEGDRDKIQALYVIGGKNLWTKDLEVALLERKVDMLVHCLKDMPTALPAGCEIGAILERENPLDSLVVKKGLSYKSLDDLPDGAVVGTSSIRRVAQLRRAYPKLKFQDVRGNVETRLAKLDDPESPMSAIILAKAGLVRLPEFSHRATADVGAPTLFYAVGQGALAIEIRSDDTEAREVLRSILHWPTEWRCTAERAYLRVLEGGCTVPVGVNSEITGEGALTLTGTVTAITGTVHVEHTITENIYSKEDAVKVGEKLAHVMMGKGAKQILEDVARDRAARGAEEANKTKEEIAKIEGTAPEVQATA